VVVPGAGTYGIPSACMTRSIPSGLAGTDKGYVLSPLHGRGCRDDGSLPLVVYCHGSGETVALTTGSDTDPGQEAATLAFLGMVAAYGCHVLLADWGGANTWGSTTAATNIAAGVTWAAANLTNVYTTKVGLIGASMGTASILAYKRDNPTKPAALCGFIPVNDLAYIRANRGSSTYPAFAVFAPTIDTAWSITSGAATPAGADLLTNANTTGTPYRAYYRADDPLMNPARHPLMVAHTGTGSSVIELTGASDYGGAVGAHNVNIMMDADWGDFARWFFPLIAA
jgi:hypothetical protein